MDSNTTKIYLWNAYPYRMEDENMPGGIREGISICYLEFKDDNGYYEKCKESIPKSELHKLQGAGYYTATLGKKMKQGKRVEIITTIDLIENYHLDL